MSDCCWWIDLGRRDYLSTWELQRRLVEQRQKGEIPDVLLFVEHPPTYTLGRNGKREHLLVDPAGIEALQAVFIETDRGGDITFHGPGQVVGYPILDLKRWATDVHAYVRALEEVIIRSLRPFGIAAGREPGLTGVWHSAGKVAAIGVRISRWVTSHGFALNVSTDLEYFRRIVPCGIAGRGVSSMTSILEERVSTARVREELASSFGSVFARAMRSVGEAELSRSVLS
jgi:lipoate-protein ligase B